MSDAILLTYNAGTVTLTFNRPQVRNALDWMAMEHLAQAIEAIKADNTVRVVIVTGAGEAFCSGGDLRDLSNRRSGADAEAMGALMGSALGTLEGLLVPVIAAVNGAALGGGSELVVACDLIVMDATARLGFVQAKRGLIPGWGGGQRLLRRVGYARALDLLLSGRTLSAQEAQNVGLVDHIAEAGEAYAEAQRWAAEVAALDPAVVRGIKTLLRAGLHQPYEAALAAERALFPALWAGETHQRTLDDFIAKRKPS